MRLQQLARSSLPRRPRPAPAASLLRPVPPVDTGDADEVLAKIDAVLAD